MAEELDCVSNAALATIKHLMKERDALRVDASRYRKVEAWFISPHSDENFFENLPGGEEPATPERFRAAVDALPSPEREGIVSCPECDKCKRHAYSDATTPGFFFDRCEKHRRLERDA